MADQLHAFKHYKPQECNGASLVVMATHVFDGSVECLCIRSLQAI